VLGLDGRRFSPDVVEQIVVCGGTCGSFADAANLLGRLTESSPSPTTVRELTRKIGGELVARRDDAARRYAERPLTAEPRRADPPVDLACVAVDGGRLQTRAPGRGRGVHDPQWRESKNAGFFRMTSPPAGDDPHPELPSCFADRRRLRSLLAGLDSLPDSPPTEPPDLSWRPQVLFRTCLASQRRSDEFGPLMAAEAERRGFHAARRKAFLADGLPYNWTLHRRHFGDFVPILDFIHVLERLHRTSASLHPAASDAWETAQKWIALCWQGDAAEVVGLLEAEQSALGPAPADAGDQDPRRVLPETLNYLRANAGRMDYPRYRAAGLPLTSCLIESQIKQMNHRVKGSEKFWNDSADAILEIRASLLGDDHRLEHHLSTRPGSPYSRPSRKPQPANSG